MRVVSEIPKPEYKITIYAWNGKYIIKFERGPFEQTYKVSEMDLSGDDDVKKIIDDEVFLKSVMDRFNEMGKDFIKAIDV